MGFPCGSDVKEGPGFDPCIRKIPWRKEWLPLQASCLENSMDRGVWQAIVHGVTKSRTQLTHKVCDVVIYLVLSFLA